MNPEQAMWLVRWVRFAALAMGLIAGMNFVCFACDWWPVVKAILFGPTITQ